MDTYPDKLADFIAAHDGAQLDQIERDLIRIVSAGGGTVTRPDADFDRPSRHTTAHWEIEALGVYARGDTRDEATRNWWRVARNITMGETAA